MGNIGAPGDMAGTVFFNPSEHQSTPYLGQPLQPNRATQVPGQQLTVEIQTSFALLHRFWVARISGRLNTVPALPHPRCSQRRTGGLYHHAPGIRRVVPRSVDTGFLLGYAQNSEME